MFPCYNSYVEIDLDKLRSNYRSIRSVLPEKVNLIPVLKCNAYGLGADTIAQVLQQEGASLFAVSQVGEGAALRKAGITGGLMVLGAFPPEQLPVAIKNDLALTVFRPEQAAAIAQEAEKQGKTAAIHIKIETGLNRIGVKLGEDLARLTETVRSLPAISLQGVFTHFMDAEIPHSEAAYHQFALYKDAVAQIRAAGLDNPLCHVCNSGASDWFTEAFLDGVRIGRRLYMDSRDQPLSPGTPGAVEDVASWRTSIVNIHQVQAGDSVGYDGVFIAKRPTTVATICVGYGDGLYTGFVPAGSRCLVRGRPSRYIGICMDQSLLDVTDLPCAIGDEVTLLGHSSDGAFLPAQELAKTVGHEGVFFTSSLSPRVERRYLYR